MGSEPHRGDDAERALGTDEHLVEVGADRRRRRAAGADHAAVGEHDLEPDDHVLDLPVAGRVLAGAAARDPSADGGQLEALGEVADRQPMRDERGLEVGPERPGVDADDARGLVDVDDALTAP